MGDDLLKQGMGGIHGVGRCAEVPPRLVVLEYTPPLPGKRAVVLDAMKAACQSLYDLDVKNVKPRPGPAQDECGAQPGDAAADDRAFPVPCLAHRVDGVSRSARP